MVDITVVLYLSELLPDILRRYIIPIYSLQRRQQAHNQGVKQAGARARLEIFLIKLLMSFVGKTEIEQQPLLTVLKKDFIAANFIYSPVET